MFKEEEGLYTFENIRFNKVEFVDNQPVVDLVEQPRPGQ
jgi:myosin heavy subunit